VLPSRSEQGERHVVNIHAAPAQQPAAAIHSTVTADRPERSATANIERHARVCTIWRHPRRSEIEEDFICWATPREIALRSDACTSAVYRHAHTTGLFKVRRKVLERLGRPTNPPELDLRAASPG